MKKILLMLSLLFFTTAGFSEVSDTLVTGGYDKQAMSDAIKHARNEAVTPADRQAVMAKMTAKRHRLESTLTVGAKK